MNLSDNPFIYQRVKKLVEENIANGTLQVGSKLTSERQLAKQLNCSFHTIRKALALLVEEGVLEREVGKGTFVKKTLAPDVKNISLVSDRISLVINPKNGGQYLTSLLEAFQKAADKKGVNIRIKTVCGFSRDVLESMKKSGDLDCAAVVIPWFSNLDNDDVYDFVSNCSRPVVLPEILPHLERCCFQKPGLYGEGTYHRTRMQCDYFKALKYSNFALFGPGNQVAWTFQMQLMEYSRFVNENNLNSHVGLVGDTFDGVDRIINKWSDMKGDLAVICYDDAYAMRLINGMHKHGWSIPEDAGILGYNNISESTYSDPPLSTMQFPFDFLSSEMIDYALKLSQNKIEPCTTNAPQRFVIRESCGGRLRLGDKLEQVILRLSEK